MRWTRAFVLAALTYPAIGICAGISLLTSSFIPVFVATAFYAAYFLYALSIYYRHSASNLYNALVTFDKLLVDYDLKLYRIHHFFLPHELTGLLMREKNEIAPLRYFIFNATPRDRSISPLHDAHCYNTMYGNFIFTTFDVRGVAPITVFNLLHELKHGGSEGSHFALQESGTAGRVMLLYLPLLFCCPTPQCAGALIAMAAMHYTWEIEYDWGEFSADVFAYNASKEMFGQENARRIIRSIRNGVQSKLTQRVAGSKRYLKSRLKGLDAILNDKVPTKTLRASAGYVHNDTIASHVMMKCRWLFGFAGIMFFFYHAVPRIETLFLPCWFLASSSFFLWQARSNFMKNVPNADGRVFYVSKFPIERSIQRAGF